MSFRRVYRTLIFLVVFLSTILLLAPEWTASASEESRLQSIVGLQEYDFLVWESNSFLDKGETILSGGQQFLDEQTRKEVVLNYLELVKQAQQLEGQINLIYSDPQIIDPDLESQDLQKELEQTRTVIEEQQLLAEAIVQEQVAEILAEQGLEILGQAWPPVLMHVTQVPSLLVVSPRDRIEKIHQVTLESGLTIPTKEFIESSVLENLDYSALVVPLGGIGTYPSMIIETSDINRLVEVVAHEWTHHWLTLHPLGLYYGLDPAVRIINETVASLVDQELGTMVVERYYPEYLPLPQLETQETPQPETEEPVFDFQTELANTRIYVEELLTEGKIEEAESYMEEQRQVFWEQGYRIRKLNQAFFAFYGAYAAEPGGAQGENPIGPMLRDIREHTSTVRDFLETVAPIINFEDLQKVHQQVTSPETAG
ncbi:MAG: hypothetical protein ACK2U0_20045 [Candidatus Promineifilaceae bacterium]|jgi:hypothetical protein